MPGRVGPASVAGAAERGAARPSVAVVIVNWNTSEEALDSAAAYAASEGVRVEVTIADNASEPSQRELLQEHGGSASIMLNDENVGYGVAVNRALADRSCEYVCASNADLRPDPRMLMLLVAACEDPSVGLAGPVLEPDHGGYHARLPGAAAFLLRPFAGSFGTRSVAEPPPGRIADVEQPAGACLLASHRTWSALGGFDPIFFLFYEDVDLARRSLEAGYRNVVVGSARAAHTGAGAVSRWDPHEHQRQRLLSLQHYAGKHHPRVAPLVGALTGIALRVRARSPR